VTPDVNPVPPRPCRRLPGWDGAVLSVVALAAAGTWLVRGRLGGEGRLALLLGLVAAWFVATARARRRAP
jgi:hypothetical protein